jgi:glutamate-1-semialdehyde aminotransferase
MKTEKDLAQSSGALLYKKAKKIIPGGTQLLSKRPEMFAPDLWPSYYKRAKGCTIWDLDDNKYTDMSIMNVGAAILGYADDDVDNAVIEAIKGGVSSSLNCPEEVYLAEKLIELHPWAGMVRYARSGGEAMSLAIRIARASTERDLILFSGYHGWADWYLAANLSDDKNLDGQLMPGLAPNGVPRGLSGTAIPFQANDIETLRTLVKGKEKLVAAIVIEPARGEEASPDYLKSLKELAQEIGSVLIFDEITSGFRMCCGGIHLNYGVSPDIAVFAKSMANGYAMSAIIGREQIMEAAQSTFISSTNWTDRVGPTAALATIKKYTKQNVAQHIIEMGHKVKEAWKEASKINNLNIKISGIATLPSFTFIDKNSIALETAFTIEMMKKGFLCFRQFRPSLAHNYQNILEYKRASIDVFSKLRYILENKNEFPQKIHHSGFLRLTKE